jgi:hypothetical protein
MVCVMTKDQVKAVFGTGSDLAGAPATGAAELAVDIDPELAGT